MFDAIYVSRSMQNCITIRCLNQII